MQSRTTSQKLYSRKRCPPLKEMTLLFKYYKTWDWIWFYFAIRKRKVTASKKVAISPPPLPRKQRKSEIPTNQYCVTLQETQRQQQQHIIWKIRMNITNQFITKLSILFLTPLKIDLSCLHKQRSCFWKRWESKMSQTSWKYWRHIWKVTMMSIHSLQSFNTSSDL